MLGVRRKDKFKMNGNQGDLACELATSASLQKKSDVGLAIIFY